MQKSVFEENKRFECSFNRIQVEVIANLPCRLEKNTSHFAYDRFFMNF